jgi:hypothetical protein
MDWETVPPGALESLSSIPTADAEAILKRALFFGCDGGFTLGRAEVYQYDKLTHRFFGCPNDGSCDLDECATAEPWETFLMADHIDIKGWAPKLAVENMSRQIANERTPSSLRCLIWRMAIGLTLRWS